MEQELVEEMWTEAAEGTSWSSVVGVLLLGSLGIGGAQFFLGNRPEARAATIVGTKGEAARSSRADPALDSALGESNHAGLRERAEPGLALTHLELALDGARRYRGALQRLEGLREDQRQAQVLSRLQRGRIENTLRAISDALEESRAELNAAKESYSASLWAFAGFSRVAREAAFATFEDKALGSEIGRDRGLLQGMQRAMPALVQARSEGQDAVPSLQPGGI